jgi:trimeric autotransporter adhesin
MSLLTIPNVFVTGTVINAAPFNVNFNAIAAVINGGIDNTNIGASGIYASQITNVSGATATFTGLGAPPWTFTNTFGSSVLQVQSAANATGNTLGVFMGTGQTANGLLIQTGGVVTGNLVTMNNSAGGLFEILATAATVITSGTTTATPLTVNMAASQSVPGLLINGAASISGNLLEVDLTSGGAKVLQFNPGGQLVLAGGSGSSVFVSGLASFSAPNNANSPTVTAAGDVVSQRSPSLGILWMGGATDAGNINYNFNVASAIALRNSAGYAPVSGGTYTPASDRSLKANIVPIPHGLDVAMKLQPSAFTWKSNGLPGLGFIAQEIEALMPELITTDNEGIKGVNYDGIIPVLAQALQDFYAEFSAYKAAHP